MSLIFLKSSVLLYLISLSIISLRLISAIVCQNFLFRGNNIHLYVLWAFIPKPHVASLNLWASNQAVCGTQCHPVVRSSVVHSFPLELCSSVLCLCSQTVVSVDLFLLRVCRHPSSFSSSEYHSWLDGGRGGRGCTRALGRCRGKRVRSSASSAAIIGSLKQAWPRRET